LSQETKNIEAMLNHYFETGGVITEDGGFREYIRNLCEKRPKICKVAKVAGTVAGAVLLVKGAMNYQKVQTMECYNSKHCLRVSLTLKKTNPTESNGLLTKISRNIWTRETKG